ncbi:hypothetical protein MPSEU_001067600 [Mayamaea pseudoterrestris]|nr:hypothetical protein MPSEU_001067600 [Mayamaea pseudoterrestris]
MTTTKDGNSSSNRDLLSHQTAGVVQWLKEQQFYETANIFEESLRKELCKKHGTNDMVTVPSSNLLQGHWVWVAEQAFNAGDDEADDESDSDSFQSEGDESEYDSDEESSESSSSEYETESSDAETDFDTENTREMSIDSGLIVIENDDAAAAAVPPPARLLDLTSAAAKRNINRSVSFDDGVPDEFFYSPVRKSEKSDVFWTKKELRDIKNEEAMEKMAAIMSDSVFQVRGLSS